MNPILIMQFKSEVEKALKGQSSEIALGETRDVAHIPSLGGRAGKFVQLHVSNDFFQLLAELKLSLEQPMPEGFPMVPPANG